MDSRTTPASSFLKVICPDLGKIARYAALATRRIEGPLVLVGSDDVTTAILEAVGAEGRPARRVPLEELLENAPMEEGSTYVVCAEPDDGDRWRGLNHLRGEHPGSIVVLWEIIGELLIMDQLSLKFGYLNMPAALWGNDSDVAALWRSYSEGNEADPFFSVTKEFDRVVSFAGKRVAELGPLDAAMTAALVHLGAKEVTCFEIRPDNYIKSAVAKDLNHWNNVRLVFDNFHSVTSAKYGRYDVLMAHGVYYHSNVPFVLLENMMSLADVICFGGFCATDSLPATEWEEQHYQGRTYRAKAFREADHFTAGVSPAGWFFDAEAVKRFFIDASWSVEVMSLVQYEGAPAGQYIRLVAFKGSHP